MESGEKKTGTRLKAELKTKRERGVTGKRIRKLGRATEEGWKTYKRGATASYILILPYRHTLNHPTK